MRSPIGDGKGNGLGLGSFWYGRWGRRRIDTDQVVVEEGREVHERRDETVFAGNLGHATPAVDGQQGAQRAARERDRLG